MTAAGLAAGLGRMRRSLLEARDTAAAAWGSEFINMGRSEPLQAWPTDELLDGALAAAGATRRYQPVPGRRDVLEAVARHYGCQLGVPLGPENILLTSGAMTGITVALATCPAGGDVLIPTPHYHAYPALVDATSRRPCLIRTGPATGWKLAADQVATAGRQPGALILNNPANPTTVSYGAAELQDLLAALEPDTAVIADEVYADYVHEPGAFASLAAVADLGGSRDWVVVRSAAKSLGRPGLRIGVLLGPAAVIEAVADCASVLTGGASVPAQLAFLAGLGAMAQADHIRPYRRRTEAALRIAQARGLTVTAPAGTYYLWLAGPALGDTSTAITMAHKAGVFAWPGEYFGATSHLRLSLSVPFAAVSAGLTRRKLRPPST
jgi:aspartate/methionine/tyrosine aminotransferase